MPHRGRESIPSTPSRRLRRPQTPPSQVPAIARNGFSPNPQEPPVNSKSGQPTCISTHPPLKPGPALKPEPTAATLHHEQRPRCTAPPPSLALMQRKTAPSRRARALSSARFLVGAPELLRTVPPRTAAPLPVPDPSGRWSPRSPGIPCQICVHRPLVSPSRPHATTPPLAAASPMTPPLAAASPTTPPLG